LIEVSVFFSEGIFSRWLFLANEMTPPPIVPSWFPPHRSAFILGAILALGLIGVAVETKAGAPSDLAPAPPEFEEVRKAAEAGDAKAQVRLGTLYSRDHSALKDYKKAAEWFSKAADQGDADGEAKLADLYFDGRGVPKDESRTAALLVKAAAQGHAESEFSLSGFYSLGVGGLPKDEALGIEFLKKSAEHGYPNGEFNLGLAYLIGSMGTKDEVVGISWIRKAAEHGFTPAQLDLGHRYEYGYGQSVTKDPDQALVWLHRVVDENDEENLLRGLAERDIERIEAKKSK